MLIVQENECWYNLDYCIFANTLIVVQITFKIIFITASVLSSYKLANRTLGEKSASEISEQNKRKKQNVRA